MIEMFFKLIIIAIIVALAFSILLLMLLGISYIIKFIIEKSYERKINTYLDENGEELLEEYDSYINKDKHKSNEDIINKALESNNIRRL